MREKGKPKLSLKRKEEIKGGRNDHHYDENIAKP